MNVSVRHKTLLKALQDVNGKIRNAATAESYKELKNYPALNDVSNVFIGLREGTAIFLKVNFLERSLAVIQSYIQRVVITSTNHFQSPMNLSTAISLEFRRPFSSGASSLLSPHPAFTPANPISAFHSTDLKS
jgi:hypothetical protein